MLRTHSSGGDTSTRPTFSPWNALPEYLVEPLESSVPIGCYLPACIWGLSSDYLFAQVQSGAPCDAYASAHHVCTLHAPCSWEGDVYLLGAAGHQALLQPEGLLLRARLGVVVSHQAPLDLEMMEWKGSGLRMWAAASLPPCCLTLLKKKCDPSPSATHPRCAQGHCGKLERCRSQGRT